jgi:hypothetical protein
MFQIRLAHISCIQPMLGGEPGICELVLVSEIGADFVDKPLEAYRGTKLRFRLNFSQSRNVISNES